VGEKNSLLSQVGHLLGGTKLQGESDGQINVLLLGIGGEGHDGPYLSDSIIVAQIRPKDKRVTMVSIPRDYLADLGTRYGQRKINSAFAEGFARNSDFDEAGKLARETVEKISGLTIPYFAVIDFQGFQKAIDLVDGIDVTVDRTFTDYTYPNNTNGYIPAVTFKEGPEHMDGKRALIFARSRHAAGPEGTDFARSQRQQKMLQAFKSKVIDLNLVTDSGKINSLLDVVGDHFHTNIGLAEMFHLYEIGKDFSKDNIVSLSLDPATGLVCDGKQEETGAYILMLCEGKTKTDIRNFFQNSFTTTMLSAENSVIWLADSSKTGKLYTKAAKTLKDAGATVVQLSYAGTQLSQNVVYQINDKPDTLKFVKDKLSASEVTLPPPGVTINKDKADLIVILGSDTN
jgi:LCP family protein required for cell wall assembly